MSEQATLELRFLGEMEILRGGERLELPPSRKTRGLLAYLALTARPHRRDRLCSLFWDVADDPRGALRWSLSRLRAIVDEPGCPRIRAPRDSVAFDAQGARIDVVSLKERCAAGLDGASVGELASLAGEFRGELLEGLDLGEFLDFQAWCVAEREEARKLHATLLRALVDRLAGDPEAALPHARTLATIDPLDEPARAGLVRLLSATGRRREAEQQYEAARRLLHELGTGGSGALEAAWRGTRESGASAPASREPAAPPSPRAVSRVVGRLAEREMLARAAFDTLRERRQHVLLLTGEPGLGKSRLLDELGDLVRERGGTVLEGRAFEAEGGRPFGPWVDALRQLPRDAVVPGLGADLAALLPEHAGAGGTPQSRDRLFAAVLELLAARAGQAPPVLLAFDDVHWLDAASAELLHYVARMSRHRPLLVALTARAGELFDNEPVQRALRGLREMRLLEEVPLGPLGPEDIRELVASLGPGIDASRVFAESAGNPLFALEVARSLPDDGGPLPRSLAELVRHRLDRLPSEAGDVLRWAAVLGCAFGAGRVGELMALDLDHLLAALELLERHALLRAHRDGASGYEFAHEVVRRVVYSNLSQPRRRLMHLRVAERLGQSGAADAAAAELAHHAALAGESVLAARACAAAGRRFLRQFANEEARAIARRGRHHAADVAEPERTRLLIELLQVELSAHRPSDSRAAAYELEALAERALEQASASHARLGFHLLAWLRWEEGDFADAQKQMMRAELVSRAGDEQAQVVAIAEAARCLALLERDLPRAEAMSLEAAARSARAGGPRPSAIADAQGMLRQHQGRLGEAAELFEQARLEARQASDPLGEFHALEHLVVLRQQEKAWPEAVRLAGELEALAGKLRKGSEGPLARAVLALGQHALGVGETASALEAAIAELRVVDAKARLAYVLTRAAQLDLETGDARRALARSEEARRMAATVGRPTEELLAGVTLARALLRTGEAGEARAIARELASPAYTTAAAHARRELEALLREESGTRPRAAGAAARRQEGRP